MNHKFTTADGSLISTGQISSVKIVGKKKTSVVIKDHEGQTLDWTDCRDTEEAKKLRDEYIKVVQLAEDGVVYKPDFSFLSTKTVGKN